MSETTNDELHGIAFDPEELRMVFATAEALNVAVTVTDEHAAFEEIIEVAQRGVSFGCDRDRWELGWQLYKDITTHWTIAEQFPSGGWISTESPAAALTAIQRYREHGRE